MTDLREKEGDEGAADNDGVENIPEVSTVAARVQHHAQIQYLRKYTFSGLFYHV